MHRRDIFDNGRRRAQYFLRLHALLQDRRQRGIRHDWARNFKRVMHWPQRERVNRIDGRQAILVLREGAGLGPEHFREETLSELLRAALVDIVSALDRYCHELVVSRIVKALGRSEKSINRELRQLYIPVLAAKADCAPCRDSAWERWPGTNEAYDDHSPCSSRHSVPRELSGT